MRARGQALTETLIATAMLVPALLAVIWVARWQMLGHGTQRATRHALLETFYAGERADIAQIAQRAEQTEASSIPVEREQFVVSVTRIDEPRAAAEMVGTAFALLRPAALLGRGEFDLAPQFAFRVETVALARRPEIMSFVDASLRFSARAVVLGSAWDAAGDSKVLQRTESLSVAGRLRSLSEIVDPLKYALGVIEPSFADFCPGRIDVSVVPVDRLQGGGSAWAGGGFAC
jgi:hypothetical protein